MLKIDSLETGYGNKKIINGISMNLGEAEIVGIIGHNGAGKSTLLKSIFGFLPVWKGSVEFDGRFIQNRKPIENVINGLSLVMQGNRVFTELDVLENIEVSGYLIKGKNELKSRINYVFELFPKLKKKQKQIAGTLSGGEQQMLTLANALLLKPKVLLLDEPSLGLASKYVRLILGQIKDISEKFGITVLIVE